MVKPATLFCAEKFRLLQEFTAAVRQLGQLQDQQVRAVIEGDPDCERFDILLHLANDRKDAAKYALLAHIDEHRCRDNDPA